MDGDMEGGERMIEDGGADEDMCSEFVLVVSVFVEGDMRYDEDPYSDKVTADVEVSDV